MTVQSDLSQEINHIIARFENWPNFYQQPAQSDFFDFMNTAQKLLRNPDTPENPLAALGTTCRAAEYLLKHAHITALIKQNAFGDANHELRVAVHDLDGKVRQLYPRMMVAGAQFAADVGKPRGTER